METMNMRVPKTTAAFIDAVSAVSGVEPGSVAAVFVALQVLRERAAAEGIAAAMQQGDEPGATYVAG